MPPLCKGRWLAWQDGGGVKVIFFYKTIPHPTPSGGQIVKQVQHQKMLQKANATLNIF